MCPVRRHQILTSKIDPRTERPNIIHIFIRKSPAVLIRCFSLFSELVQIASPVAGILRTYTLRDAAAYTYCYSSNGCPQMALSTIIHVMKEKKHTLSIEKCPFLLKLTETPWSTSTVPKSGLIFKISSPNVFSHRLLRQS